MPMMFFFMMRRRRRCQMITPLRFLIFTLRHSITLIFISFIDYVSRFDWCRRCRHSHLLRHIFIIFFSRLDVIFDAERRARMLRAMLLSALDAACADAMLAAIDVCAVAAYDAAARMMPPDGCHARRWALMLIRILILMPWYCHYVCHAAYADTLFALMPPPRYACAASYADWAFAIFAMPLYAAMPPCWW